MRGVIRAVSILAILGTLSCSSRQTVQQLPSHTHKHPNTTCMDNYHIRLVVDHDQGQMMLIFEDLDEEPVELVRVPAITAAAVLPDGSVKKEIFQPTPPLKHKFIKRYHHHMTHCFVDKYVAQADWLITTSEFKLYLRVPFEGTYHDVTFNYEKHAP